MSGDLEAAQRRHAEGVASLEKAGAIALAISAAYDGAELRRARGRLTEAGKLYERSLQLGLEHGDPALPGMADLHLGLSELHCERNDLATATRHLRRSEELGNLRETPYRRCIAQARLRRVHGDLAGAVGLLEEAERLYVRGPVPDIRPITAMKVRAWLGQGRLAEATDWVRQHGLSVDDDLDYLDEFEHITLARVLIARSERQRDDCSAHEARRLA